MAYTTLVAGTTITASWANANVRDQAVTPFASTGARTSAITSPVTGMVSYITGTSRLEIYNGAVWVPVPGTMIGRGARTTSSSTTTTETAVLRVDSIPVTSGRAYVVATSPLWLASSVANDIITGRIRFDTSGNATTSSTILGEAGAAQPSGASAGVPIVLPFIATGTGNVSFLLSVGRVAGSGNCSIAASAGHPTIDLTIVEAGIDPTDTGVDL